MEPPYIDAADAATDFVLYCCRNPQLRFWQALRNWSGHNFIYVSDKLPDLIVPGLEDTFHMNGVKR